MGADIFKKEKSVLRLAEMKIENGGYGYDK
jgi:hypothetical protein